MTIREFAGETVATRSARRRVVHARPGGRPREQLLNAVAPSDLARMLAGFGNPSRVRVARAVLSGANTHHALSQAVGLRTGPLYHHLRELERSGLLMRVDRNRYDLSRRGRDLLLVCTASMNFRGNGAAGA
jgi:DNA-binding HxlR family transcriptional regulator